MKKQSVDELEKTLADMTNEFVRGFNKAQKLIENLKNEK